MKLYLAGNPGHGKAGLYREQYLRKVKAQLVMSYYWVQEGGDFHNYFRRMIYGKTKDAFSGRRNHRHI